MTYITTFTNHPSFHYMSRCMPSHQHWRSIQKILRRNQMSDESTQEHYKPTWWQGRLIAMNKSNLSEFDMDLHPLEFRQILCDGGSDKLCLYIEKIVMCLRYGKYLHQTNSNVLTILSIINWTTFLLPSTIINDNILFDYVFCPSAIPVSWRMCTIRLLLPILVLEMWNLSHHMVDKMVNTFKRHHWTKQLSPWWVGSSPDECPMGGWSRGPIGPRASHPEGILQEMNLPTMGSIAVR